MISIVACCHGAKLCIHAARDFRSQQYLDDFYDCKAYNTMLHIFNFSKLDYLSTLVFTYSNASNSHILQYQGSTLFVQFVRSRENHQKKDFKSVSFQLAWFSWPFDASLVSRFDFNVARNKLAVSMFEPKVFRKQMYCIEESACDMVGTLRCPRHGALWTVSVGNLAFLKPDFEVLAFFNIFGFFWK